MLTLVADFNAVSNGLVRGLSEDLHGGEPRLGALVLLCDGEEQEAFGVVREARDGLVFAAVDWETLSPEGAYRYWSALPVLDHGRSSPVTGDVRPAPAKNPTAGRLAGIAERLILLPEVA